MLIDNNVTRLAGGFNTVPRGVADIWNSLKVPDASPLYRRFDEDFYSYTVAQWVITAVGAGGAVARGNGNGGLITLTTDTANNDTLQMQRLGAGIAGLSWLIDPAKPLFMSVRASLDVLTASAYLGLAATDTTIMPGTAEGISFRLATGGALSLVSELATVEVALALGTITAATVFEAQLFWDGQGAADGRMYGALNGDIAGYLSPGVASFPTAALTVTAAIQSLTAAAKVLTLDRIVIIQPL